MKQKARRVARQGPGPGQRRLKPRLQAGPGILRQLQLCCIPYLTGFQVPHPRVVNQPSVGAIVTVIVCADVANWLSMVPPAVGAVRIGSHVIALYRGQHRLAHFGHSEGQVSVDGPVTARDSSAARSGSRVLRSRET